MSIYEKRDLFDYTFIWRKLYANGKIDNSNESVFRFMEEYYDRPFRFGVYMYVLTKDGFPIRSDPPLDSVYILI